MRDLQHWKDKVELSLDGRQVFFLFFGGAVLACMLFALGVMTGRRLEARAIALETPGTEDPLAALNQLGDLEDEELTYHRALTKDGNRTPHGKDASKVAAPGKPVAQQPKPVVPPKLVVPHAPSADHDADAPKPVVAAEPLAPPAPVAQKLPEPPLPRPVVADAPKPAPKPAGKPTDNKPEGKIAAAPGQAHFTLQLSAFSARKDADDLVHRVQAAGFKPFVVASDVPGKGMVFRVRVGDFASKDAAIAEKSAVENKLKVSAFLAKL